MLTLALVLGSFMILMFLLIGGVIGYLTYGYLASQTNIEGMVPDHPEFYDEEGNIIHEDLITIRFENSYDQMIDWEDD
jgi:hypothetical protein